MNIQLPPKGSDKEEIITITGLEADALAAKDAILKESVERYTLLLRIDTTKEWPSF